MDISEPIINGEIKLSPKEFLENFFPGVDVPRSPYTLLEEQLDGYIKNQVGRLNRDGYRSDDFLLRGAINVLTIGCSNVEGSGVKPLEVFSEHLRIKMEDNYGVPVANWNLGMGGTSADYVSRTLLSAVNFLSPDIVIVVFTEPTRREVFDQGGIIERYQGVRMKEFANLIKNKTVKFRERDLLLYQKLLHYHALSNPTDDAINAIRNYQLIKLLLDAREMMWGFTTIFDDPVRATYEAVVGTGLIDTSNQINDFFQAVDYVDPEVDHHPGPKSHLRFGQVLFDWFVSRYNERLRHLAVQYREPSYRNDASTFGAQTVGAINSI